MGRLIDADLLIKDLLEQIPLAENVPIFKEIIESQPTAYDVDKVIEQLEELKYANEECHTIASMIAADAYVAAIMRVEAGGRE